MLNKIMDKKNIIILTVVFIIFSILFYAKSANMLIDFSRESYIPYQMLNNKILYKDIFLIYGFFGYFINYLIYKISLNINLILILAHILSYFILILFYYIAKKITSKSIALVFSMFFLTVSIFSNSTFSFVVPYSYSNLWGVFAVYLGLFSILYQKDKLLFLSLGLVFVNRIEFFIPVLLFSLIFFHIQKRKILINIPYLIVFPLIECLYIYLNKISLKDIINNFSFIKTMVLADSIKTLYKGMGSFFEIEYFKHNLILTLIFGLIFVISFILFKYKKPVFSYIFLFISFLYAELNFCLNLSAFVVVFLFIFLLIKKQIRTREIMVFFFAMVLASKCFFAINPLSYSNSAYCLILMLLYKFLSKFLDRKWLTYSFIILFTLIACKNISYYFKNQKYPYTTNIGTVYLNKDEIELFKKLNLYIKKNIKKDENFIVVPEGQIINLIHQKPFQYYNSTFTPLDFETFGEKNIITNLKQSKTDYIIFYPRNTHDYGADTICFDYAVDFCTYISDNYTRTAIIEAKSRALVFKRK